MIARAELIADIDDMTVKCARIKYKGYDWHARKSMPAQWFTLRVNHTPEEYAAFLDALNFEYDNSYGYQHIYGVVWFADGTWLDREEYDGAEWWSHRVVPDIDPECMPEADEATV